METNKDNNINGNKLNDICDKFDINSDYKLVKYTHQSCYGQTLILREQDLKANVGSDVVEDLKNAKEGKRIIECNCHEKLTYVTYKHYIWDEDGSYDIVTNYFQKIAENKS